MLAASYLLLLLGGCVASGNPAEDTTASFVRENGVAGASTAQRNNSDPNQLEADYRIQPLDVLEITVFQVKDLDGTRQVSRTGYISMPLIGELPAKGKSVKELEMTIAARLGTNYLRAPDVHVSVKDFTSQRYTIEGEVAGPGIYPLAGRTTLLQAIAQAKGLTRVADYNVAIFRDVNNTRLPTTYDISSIRSGEREDPILIAGDVIVVGESAIRSAWTEFKDIFGVGLQGAGFATRLAP
ncbi:hypothetical+protein [Methylocapsa aurea]|jgi:polysaccharide export outer membrane protein